MTRMIERWFPCAEVSVASGSGWGGGRSEKAMFTWFAARPPAQAKAAVITSVLPWPESEEEQRRLQDIVRRAMQGRDANHDELVAELHKHYPDGARLLDPFCGRAIIPLEAAHLGVRADGIDYSTVAMVAGRLLSDYPLRDWSSEPPLPLDDHSINPLQHRLLQDVERVLAEVGRRHAEAMCCFYPAVNGERPWGYLWALSLPCQECGNRFPLVGSLVLRHPVSKKKDPGQSFRICTDSSTGTFSALVHDGPPTEQPTRRVPKGKSKYDAAGKVAICPFCSHVHTKAIQARLGKERLLEDVLLVVADHDKEFGKIFRGA